MAGQKNGGKNIAGKQKSTKETAGNKNGGKQNWHGAKLKWRKRKMAGVEKRRAIRKMVCG